MLNTLPGYFVLIKTLQPVFEDLKSTLTQIGSFYSDTTKVPLYAAKAGNGPRQILITAGTHGEEQAAPLALAEFLKHDLKHYLKEYTFTIIPIINPTGFEKKTRRGSGNKDLNRYFGKVDCFPENEIVLRYLKNCLFNHHLDMHEDIDQQNLGAYIYETGDGSADPQIFELCYKFLDWISLQGIKVNKNPKICGMRSKAGIIPRSPGAKTDPQIGKLGSLGGCLVLKGISKRVTTLETSMNCSLESRLHIQRRHLNFWLQTEVG